MRRRRNRAVAAPGKSPLPGYLPPLLLLLLLPFLLLAFAPEGGAAAETAPRPERSRHLTIGAGSLSFDGLPLLQALTGEVSIEGGKLLIDGRFEFRGGAGAARVARDASGALELSVLCRGIRPAAPFDGSVDFDLAGGGPAGSLEASFAGTIGGLSLTLTERGGATAEVAFGDGQFHGRARQLARTLFVTADGTCGGARFAAELSGPSDAFGEAATGEISLSLRDLPLPAEGGPALRIGGRIDAFDLAARIMARTAEVTVKLEAPLARLSAELLLSRTGDLAGTAEVRASREAVGDAIRLGPFDFLIGETLHFELALSGTARRPRWRVLRRL